MKFFAKLFDDTCKAYTLSALALLLLRLALSGSFENTMIEPRSFLLLLPFAIGVALASGIYRVERWAHALRLTAHFLLCVVGAFLFLYLPMTSASPSAGLVALLLLSVLYWIVMSIYLVATAKRRMTGKSAGAYQTVFKK